MGGKLSAQANGLFDANDAPGVWALFARYVDVLGVAHDGPEVELLVGAAAGADPLRPEQPLRLDKLWVAAGASLHGNVRLINGSSQTVAVSQAELTARAPGDDDAGGTAYGFGNPQSGQVAPGAQLGLAGDRPFGVSEDTCAGVVCTVEGGQCRFTVAQ